MFGPLVPPVMFASLSSRASEIVQKEFAQKNVNITFIIPKDQSHGDATTTVALSLAKDLKKKPQEIAQALVEKLGKLEEVEKAEVAGPGYVNLWLTPKALIAELAASREACIPKVKRKEAPMILEYSQPNIAKPLAIHHIIGTVLGQSMVNLYRHLGFPVVSWNYIGDWGTQFGKLSVAYEKWGKKKPIVEHTLDELLALYVRFHEEAQKDETLEEQGREAFLKLEQGDASLRAFWKDVVTVTKNSLQDVYERLHVSFDLDLGESFYEDKMANVIEEGKKKGVFTEGEGGSLIVQFPEELNMPPYLIVKADGATLYSTRDLAQMRYRIDTYHPAGILIFTDIAQKLHFEQLVETCKMLGWELPHFENVLFGRMRFADKSMSTRKGNVLKLEHVLEEAVERADEIITARGEDLQSDDPKDLAEMMGTGALVYGILSQNRKMDLVFDWEKMLSFEGNSAPYLQYTHARAQSVLRKSGASSKDIGAMTVDALTDSERGVLRVLLSFPEVLEDARETAMPHKLANFLYELSQAFNLFYHKDPILKADGSKKEFRLALTTLTTMVLQTGATILTLRLPDQM